MCKTTQSHKKTSIKPAYKNERKHKRESKINLELDTIEFESC